MLAALQILPLAFVATGPLASPMSRSAVCMSSALKITGNNVELTEPLQQYANDKLSKPLDRYVDLINGADLHLKVEKRVSDYS